MGRSSNERATLVPLSSGRSLKTAAEALAALRLLGANPDGVTAEALATELGKSASTARYLLNTLCQEGYAMKAGPVGVHRLATTPPWGGPWGTPARASRRPLPDRLCDAVTELYMRTRQRTYLAQWDDDATVIVDSRGHQGLARVPAVAERIPLSQAHAPAVTKALIAGSDDLEARVVGQDELASFTATTITSRAALASELAGVRRRGVALDREEFAEGFCCVGAPIVAPDGSVAASIAVSGPARRFDQDSAEIARTVAEVAAVAAREWRQQVAADGPLEPSEPPTNHTGRNDRPVPADARVGDGAGP